MEKTEKACIKGREKRTKKKVETSVDAIFGSVVSGRHMRERNRGKYYFYYVTTGYNSLVEMMTLALIL